MSRQCSRTGCTEAAVACMGYQYSERTAWIDGIADERDPHAYDLCERHAARLSVPYGWVLDDRRQRVRAEERLAG